MTQIQPAPTESPRYTIHIVAERLGLTPDAVRKWERRHKAVTPFRTPGGHRLYSEADCQRLILLRRLTAAGKRIGQIAGMTTDELRSVLEAHNAPESAAS